MLKVLYRTIEPKAVLPQTLERVSRAQIILRSLLKTWKRRVKCETAETV